MTTHKEMTLDDIAALEKYDRRECFADSADGMFAAVMYSEMLDYIKSRHPKPMGQAEATLREDGGEPCCDVDLNETVWHDKYHQLCERCWKALGITEYTGLSIPEHIAALKNPSDAGGVDEFDMEEALNKAERLRE